MVKLADYHRALAPAITLYYHDEVSKVIYVYLPNFEPLVSGNRKASNVSLGASQVRQSVMS